jgi:hypothetical protein
MSALAASADDTRPWASACRISVRRTLGRVVVSVRGELDRPGVGVLDGVLTDLIDGQGNLDVVVDLSGAGWCDPLTLVAFERAAEQARRHRGHFTVHRARGAPALSQSSR